MFFKYFLQLTARVHHMLLARQSPLMAPLSISVHAMMVMLALVTRATVAHLSFLQVNLDFSSGLQSVPLGIILLLLCIAYSMIAYSITFDTNFYNDAVLIPGEADYLSMSYSLNSIVSSSFHTNYFI